MTKCAICKLDDEGTGIIYYKKNICARCECKYSDLKKKLTIKEEAAAYQPQQTKNVADLKKVSTSAELKEHTAKQGTPDEFKYKYIEVDGEKYRVPGVVIGDLKAILEKMPNLEYVIVLKQGTGTATRYQVLPYTEPEVKVEKIIVG